MEPAGSLAPVGKDQEEGRPPRIGHDVLLAGSVLASCHVFWPVWQSLCGKSIYGDTVREPNPVGWVVISARLP